MQRFVCQDVLYIIYYGRKLETNVQQPTTKELRYVHQTKHNAATKVHIIGMEIYSQHVK